MSLVFMACPGWVELGDVFREFVSLFTAQSGLPV
jgi:hypothetical protein